MKHTSVAPVLLLLPLLLQLPSGLQAQPGSTAVQPRQPAGALAEVPRERPPLLRVSPTGIDSVAAPRDGVRLAPGEWSVERTGTRAEPLRLEHAAVRDMPAAVVGAAVGAEERRYRLPYRIVLADPETGRPRRLAAEVDVPEAGLPYDAVRRRYRGRLAIGLLDLDTPPRPGPLRSSATVQITGGVEADPEVLTLDRVGAPFQEAWISAGPVVSGDSVRFRLRTDFDQAGILLSVPVRQPRLQVTASTRGRILGFGLGAVDVYVRPLDDIGSDSLVVTFTAGQGSVTPNRLPIGPNGGTARLRSGGTGADEVTVHGGAFVGSLPLQYVMPSLFLFVAVVGGLMGGLVRAFSRDRRSDPRALSILALEGVLIGVPAVVLTALGVRLLRLPMEAATTEAMAFAVAFLTGMVGPTVFDRVLPGLARSTQAADAEGAEGAG